MMDNLDELMQRKLENGREYRNLVLQIEQREGEGEEKVVEGYATTFDEPYKLLETKDYIVLEQVDAHAFDECDMSDVIMQYDHRGRVFSRVSNGTLQLQPDAHGLHVRADLGGTEIGRQLFEEIKGGYTTRMSFGFVVAEDEREKMEERVNGKTSILRTIRKIAKTYDVSAVSIPANDATEISSRAYGEGVIAEAEAECEKMLERERRIKRIKLLLEVTKT